MEGEEEEDVRVWRIGTWMGEESNVEKDRELGSPYSFITTHVYGRLHWEA